MKKIKYIFKDAFAPHVGTCTCANLLQDGLIEDGSDIRVHWCSIPHPSQRYRKNKIYEMDDCGNIILKDPATKLLQKKVHPREGEGFGLHYVYTYDEIPTDEQLSSSFLVYVCCEEVEGVEMVAGVKLCKDGFCEEKVCGALPRLSRFPVCKRGALFAGATLL